MINNKLHFHFIGIIKILCSLVWELKAASHFLHCAMDTSTDPDFGENIRKIDWNIFLKAGGRHTHIVIITLNLSSIQTTSVERKHH